MNYNDLTRYHFETAAHAGVLSGPDTRRGAAGSRAQGAWVQFDLDLDLDLDIGGKGGDWTSRAPPYRPVIRAARFLAYGCPHVIAVADWLAQQATGLQARPVLPESVASLRERFEVPVEKLGRLLMVEDAWIATVSPPYHEREAI